MLKITTGIRNSFLLIMLIFATLIDSSKSLGLVLVEWNVDSWSKWIFGIFFAFIIIAFILMVVAAVTNNKPINGLAAWRLIVFGMGASSVWLIGSQLNNSYRGLNGRWLRIFWNRMHIGIFGNTGSGGGGIKIFNEVKNDAGLAFPFYWHYLNRYLVELLLALIGKGLFFVGTPMMKMLSAAIVTSLSGRLSLGFVQWWKQNYYIGIQNGNGGTFDRATAGHAFGWVFAAIGLLLSLENIAMMFITAKASIMPDLGDRKKNYKETSKNEKGGQISNSNIFNFTRKIHFPKFKFF